MGHLGLRLVPFFEVLPGLLSGKKKKTVERATGKRNQRCNLRENIDQKIPLSLSFIDRPFFSICLRFLLHSIKAVFLELRFPAHSKWTLSVPTLPATIPPAPQNFPISSSRFPVHIRRRKGNRRRLAKKGGKGESAAGLWGS